MIDLVAMKRITIKYSCFCILIFILIAAVQPVFAMEKMSTPRFVVELEGGGVWQSKNDVQIPKSSQGTRFSLLDVAGEGPWPVGRLYLTWNISPRHGLRALAAPLQPR